MDVGYVCMCASIDVLAFVWVYAAHEFVEIVNCLVWQYSASCFEVNIILADMGFGQIISSFRGFKGSPKYKILAV